MSYWRPCLKTVSKPVQPNFEADLIFTLTVLPDDDDDEEESDGESEGEHRGDDDKEEDEDVDGAEVSGTKLETREMIF
jgi:hypothetical protein